MPNWTRNRLELIGPADELEAVRALLLTVEQPLDFNAVAPMPPILLRVISPSRLGPNGRSMLQAEGADPLSMESVEATVEEQAAIDAFPPHLRNWYDWASANWGTKWNACDVSFANLGDRLVYEFNTAWDAPRAFYDAMLGRVRAVAPNVAVRAEAQHEDDGYEATEVVVGEK